MGKIYIYMTDKKMKFRIFNLYRQQSLGFIMCILVLYTTCVKADKKVYLWHKRGSLEMSTCSSDKTCNGTGCFGGGTLHRKCNWRRWPRLSWTCCSGTGCPPWRGWWREGCGNAGGCTCHLPPEFPGWSSRLGSALQTPLLYRFLPSTFLCLCFHYQALMVAENRNKI